jgi:hypothetical protein
MKIDRVTKARRVIDAMLDCPNAGLSRFEAVEIADKILLRHKGNLKLAIKDAKNPYIISGRPTW